MNSTYCSVSISVSNPSQLGVVGLFDPEVPVAARRDYVPRLQLVSCGNQGDFADGFNEVIGRFGGSILSGAVRVEAGQDRCLPPV